jgi:hypothetical protein
MQELYASQSFLMYASCAKVLERDPLVSVVRSYADLSEAVAVSPALELDVILLDASVPDGEAAVRLTLEIAPGMRIIAFPVSETERTSSPGRRRVRLAISRAPSLRLSLRVRSRISRAASRSVPVGWPPCYFAKSLSPLSAAPAANRPFG